MPGTYFEDFAVGEVYEHQRGRTVTDHDNYALTHLSMNTAHAHFDVDCIEPGAPLGRVHATSSRSSSARLRATPQR